MKKVIIGLVVCFVLLMGALKLIGIHNHNVWMQGLQEYKMKQAGSVTVSEYKKGNSTVTIYTY